MNSRMTRNWCNERPKPGGTRAALLLVMVVAAPSLAQVRDWNTGDGQFSNPANWTPNMVPSFADLVRIGNHPAAENSVVTLDASGLVAALEITDGMQLRTHGEYLGAIAYTTVSGQNDPPGPDHFASRLVVSGGAAGPGYDFATGDLTLTNGGHATLNPGARLNVNHLLDIHDGSTLLSSGTVRLYGDDAVAMSLDGNINAQPGMIIHQLGDGLIDLDGAAGNGHIELLGAPIDGFYDSLTIHGDALADSFGGSVAFNTGAMLNMNLDSGWTADANSWFEIVGNGSGQSARILGGDWTFGGFFTVYGNSGSARVESDTTIQPTADIRVDHDDQLMFTGEVTVLGGSFMLQQGANLNFQGPTELRGGLFTTPSDTAVTGAVNFNGPTQWDGDVEFRGLARQVADASVTGPTVIDAEVLDMDGNGTSTWNIGANLVVNTQSVDSTVSNTFDGTMNLTGGFTPRLTINLDDPAGQWTMGGTMNLAGSQLAVFPIDRVGGSPMRVTGDVHVEHRVRISADTLFDDGSSVQFADAAAALYMSGTTRVEENATFLGEGTFRNNAGGVMTLADGVSLDEVGLVNGGLLSIADGAGSAAVARFDNSEDGTWLVGLGGHLAGSEHDLLLVTDGEALLGGVLEVALLDLGGGLFAPQIGDAFTVLTSVDGISGTFANSPITHAGELSYLWSVQYGTHEVTLLLDSIVPEPTSLVFMVLGGATLMRRGRGSRGAERL